MGMADSLVIGGGPGGASCALWLRIALEVKTSTLCVWSCRHKVLGMRTPKP